MGLGYLDLSYNYLSGSIPNTLSKPQTLIVSYNVLTGPVPAALTATNLQLNHNRLTSFTSSYCSMVQVYQCVSNCWYGGCCAFGYVSQCLVSRRYDVLLLDNNKISSIDSCVASSGCASVFAFTASPTSSPSTGKFTGAIRLANADYTFPAVPSTLPSTTGTRAVKNFNTL
jgi:hypothetical protein